MEHIDDKELIRKLQRAREKKSISYNMLVEMTKEIGQGVAYSTISKVFGKDGENTSFNYINTLQPLAKVLLTDDEHDEDDEDFKFEVITLRSELKIRDVTIEMLKTQIEALQGEKELLKSQVDIKDKRMNDQTEMINRVMDESEQTRKRIMDRNDKKEATIFELMQENKKLEEDLREIRNRCKLCDNYISKGV